VKPNDQGSTVGLTIIDDYRSLSDAISNAFKYSRSVIIEQYISGKEITVPILGRNPLPIIEIIPATGIYDYECKYQPGKTQYIVPAKLPIHIFEKIQSLALEAFQVLGCRHYARVDFRLSVDMTPFCLEVNTLPGMTPTSLVPKAALSIGINFSELIERILQLAIDQFPYKY
jgi:D-alanine-D-alanine ligase